MRMKLLSIILLTQASIAHAWTDFKTSDKNEIRNLLRYDRDLLDDYLLHAAENPGTKITEFTGRYITVRRETGGEKVYSCEIEATLLLSDLTRLSSKVEVEKLCEHIF